jgi:acetyl esterase/lipase
MECAFQWALSTMPQLRWSLGGASAGANLAAGLAFQLRDHKDVLPASLVLAYGAFHPHALRLRADLGTKLKSLSPASALTPEFIEAIALNYVDNANTLCVPYAFPGGHDAAGLPPTLVLNSDLDTLRPSGEAFAAGLAMAGVDVCQVCEPGSRHGHLSRDQPQAASRSIQRIVRWMHSTTRKRRDS